MDRASSESSDAVLDPDADAESGAVVRPVRGLHGLRRYIVRRLIQALVVLMIVVTVVFAMSRLAANPVDILLPPGSTPELRAALTRTLGLDRSLIVQYGIFWENLLHGSLGTSSLFNVQVLSLVAERALPTIRLGLTAVAWAALLGVPLGIYLARRQGAFVDRAVGVFIALAQGVASFWLAVLLIFVFSVSLGWLPVSGDSEGASIILPAVALGLAPFVALVRLTRGAMIETLASDYVRNARARGVNPRVLILRHALRNALPPVITFGGILLGELISGAVITETIFAWPGIGQLSILAITNGDYALVQGVTIVSASAIIFLNLAVDLIQLWLNPRAREGVMAGGRL